MLRATDLSEELADTCRKERLIRSGLRERPQRVGCGRLLRRVARAGFGHFHGKHVSGPEHIGAEDHPFLVGRKADVGLQTILVVCHVHEAFGAEHAWLDEGLVVNSAIVQELLAEEVEPAAVRGFGDLTGIASITADECPVAGDVEMDGPLVALEVIPGPAAGFQLVGGQPEILAARGL